MIAYCSDWYIKNGTIEGKAATLAVKVKEEKGIFGSLLSGLSSSEEGLKMIDYLIQNQIFFDPSFISEEEYSEKIFTHVDKETLLDTFNINTDLELVYISPDTLKEQELCEALAYAIKNCSRKLKVVIDYTLDKENIALFDCFNPIVVDKALDDKNLIELLANACSFS